MRNSTVCKAFIFTDILAVPSHSGFIAMQLNPSGHLESSFTLLKVMENLSSQQLYTVAVFLMLTATVSPFGKAGQSQTGLSQPAFTSAPAIASKMTTIFISPVFDADNRAVPPVALKH